MTRSIIAVILPVLVLSVACSETPDRTSAVETSAGSDVENANAGIDSLNSRLSGTYRDRNTRAYAELFTDSAVFEWPAFNTVRGRPALEAMVGTNWATLSDQDLKLTIASRRFAPGHATEFGAFEQSYRDPQGVRKTEYGRYVTVLARQPDGTWLIDRFFGFADSTGTR